MDSTRNEIEQSQNNFRQKVEKKLITFAGSPKFLKLSDMIYPYGGGASEMLRMPCSRATLNYPNRRNF